MQPSVLGRRRRESSAGAARTPRSIANRPSLPQTLAGGDLPFVPEQVLRTEPFEPLIITCCNRRGGCGKTTNSAAIAWALAHRGYDVMFADMDPQTDASQFMLAPEIDKAAANFSAKYKELARERLRPGMPKEQRQAQEEELLEEAKAAAPYGYAELIDRKHIDDNAEGTKVRTVWEAMENFRTLGALTTPKEIVPIPILPREGILEKKDGMHGRLLLVAGHKEMTQMEGKIHAGEAASGGDINVAWLTVPHHVLKQTAVKNRWCSPLLLRPLSVALAL